MTTPERETRKCTVLRCSNTFEVRKASKKIKCDSCLAEVRAARVRTPPKRRKKHRRQAPLTDAERAHLARNRAKAAVTVVTTNWADVPKEDQFRLRRMVLLSVRPADLTDTLGALWDAGHLSLGDKGDLMRMVGSRLTVHEATRAVGVLNNQIREKRLRAS
jgi:hypothetical protein